jgi:hypothetical protein
VFTLAIAVLSGTAQNLLISTTKILVLFIPLVVIIAGTTGYFDGKTRFRKIKNSAILKRKIVYASLLLAISIALAVLIWTEGFEKAAFTSVDALLTAVAVGLIVPLSLLGMSFKDAAFPGN